MRGGVSTALNIEVDVRTEPIITGFINFILKLFCQIKIERDMVPLFLYLLSNI